MRQRTDEWADARLGRVTASRFKDVISKPRGSDPLSASAETYLCELLADHLCGRQPSPGDFTPKSLQWGIDHEEDARGAYCWKVGFTVEPEGFIDHPDEPLIGGSPDGLIADDGLIEIKCPYTSKEHVRTIIWDHVPPVYKPQVQGLLWVTGRDYCDYISFDPRMPPENRLYIKRELRDPAYIRDLESKVLRFRDILAKQLSKFTEDEEERDAGS